jgi:hypothetical protein
MRQEVNRMRYDIMITQLLAPLKNQSLFRNFIGLSIELIHANTLGKNYVLTFSSRTLTLSFTPILIKYLMC